MCIAMNRCVACLMQNELANVRDELAKEIEQNQERAATASEMIESLKVLGVHACIYTYAYCKSTACVHMKLLSIHFSKS